MTDWDDLAIDGHGNLCDLAAAPTFPPPPDYTWTLIEQFELLTPVFGQVAADASTWGQNRQIMRVVSDLYSDSSGRWVRLVTDKQWDAWQAIPAGVRPPFPRWARAVSVQYVWVMHEAPQNGAG